MEIKMAMDVEWEWQWEWWTINRHNESLTLAAPTNAPRVATHAASFVSSVSKCPCLRGIVSGCGVFVRISMCMVKWNSGIVAANELRVTSRDRSVHVCLISDPFSKSRSFSIIGILQKERTQLSMTANRWIFVNMIAAFCPVHGCRFQIKSRVTLGQTCTEHRLHISAAEYRHTR